MDSNFIDGISLEDAFAQAVADLSDSPASAPAQQVQDPAPQQSEDTSAQEDANAAADQSQQQTQSVEPANQEGQPASAQADTAIVSGGVLDYQKLYEDAKHKRDSLEGRLNALAAQYRELQASVAAPAPAQIPAQSTAPIEEDDDKDDLPDNVKELFETFPEMAAMKELIDRKLSKALSKVEKTVESKVQPIVDRTTQDAIVSHLTTIKSAHPDLDAIIDSGDLLKWKDELPLHSRAGVEYYMEFGTAPQVIELLNEYKASRGFNKTNNTQAQQQQPQQAQATQDIVQQVKASMAVPSNRTTPNVDNTVPQVQARSLEDEFNEAVKMLSF